jgi:hypothetical protein
MSTPAATTITTIEHSDVSSVVVKTTSLIKEIIDSLVSLIDASLRFNWFHSPKMMIHQCVFLLSSTTLTVSPIMMMMMMMTLILTVILMMKTKVILLVLLVVLVLLNRTA